MKPRCLGGMKISGRALAALLEGREDLGVSEHWVICSLRRQKSSKL